MGRLTYNDEIHVDVDDRALLHLQYVMCDKLRRGESFLFSWVTPDVPKPGLRMVWINSQSQLTFKYHGGRPPSLNRAWLEALAMTTNSVGGLYLVPEPPGEEFETGRADIEQPSQPAPRAEDPPAA
jgi:hypothetical protein